MSNLFIFLVFGLSFLVQVQNGVSIDYGAALTKSLLYYEAQRSGKLPPNQRANWRADSGLNDGKGDGIDLVGGYYDAGDNVKFGLPMAFTLTMLAWSILDFGPQLAGRRELSNALDALKWGTDYLIKAHPQPDVLYGEVGDGVSDHNCWQRPEDMTTSRKAYKIDDQHPGSDLAGETAAALAAAAVVYRYERPKYSALLLNHAEQLFDFATTHKGKYTDSIPAGEFYQSSGYDDELLWAAAWLRLATNDNKYVGFISSANPGGLRIQFSWDDKYAGATLLVAKAIRTGKLPNSGNFAQMANYAEQFLCNSMQKGSSNVKMSKGGLLWFFEWNNLQFVTSASFLLTDYADILQKTKGQLNCAGGVAQPADLLNFAKSQVDYILGNNPKQISYMVGFGSNFPKQVHHRAASIVSIKQDPTPVGCKEGYDKWYNKNADNPNVLEGAVVGGPDQNDQFTDARNNFKQTEPPTVNNAPLVGILAKLAA